MGMSHEGAQQKYFPTNKSSLPEDFVGCFNIFSKIITNSISKEKMMK